MKDRDAASRAKLREQKSAIFTEKYDDYLKLGVEEWRKSYAEHETLGKNAVLVVMVDDTRNCDEVGAYLEKICPELQGTVLVIHTKNNGEISEAASGKNKEELEKLRREANGIDTLASPYKAIVSVLMLKEGWDVRDVTTIVGLRAYAAESNILPEQTLGRGLRRMYFGTDQRETVSVMGTPAFMEFVESLQTEGVSFEHSPMSEGAARQDSLIVEVDTDNPEKDLNALTIQDSGSARIEDRTRLREMRPFRTESRPFLAAKKSLFNRTVGEPNAGALELSFAAFLQSADDVVSFAKNYLAVGFKIDDAKADGDLSSYTPDFFVKTTDGNTWIVEMKGREEIDVPQKMARLRQRCADATAASVDEDAVEYRFVFVDEDGFERHAPGTFAALAASFTEYQA
ncbi:MAG: hypothetical protein SGJ09_14825 [Phycisphaerae bacterium]|nr:hypothetical protein [Phycisphaerae bacterium]